MAEDIKMPALGESVTDATVTAWLKQVGDTVEADEPIVEVATDKVDSEVPSPVAGVLLEILVQEDETVDVGTVIARVASADEAGSAAAPAAPAATPAFATTLAPTASAGGAAANAANTILKMPALGESVTEGTVTAWLKQVGDTVEADEPIVEVATDKVDSEVPAPSSGKLLEILVQEDETVAVGTPIAVIGADLPTTTAAPSASAPTAPAAPAAATPVPPAPAPVAPAAPAAPAAQASVVTDLYVTPIVRKLAKDLGVDLSQVKGTGGGGRITREDVRAASPSSGGTATGAVAKPATRMISTEAAELRGTTQKMSRLRQTIATRMVESLQTAAQLTTVLEVDVTRIANLRAKYKAQFEQVHGTRLTFLPFFVLAATEALQNHPKLNARIDGKEVTYFDYENVGIAVDAPKGLMVPVIKNAGSLQIPEIARQINEMAAAVRDGKATPDQLTGGTFTITNTGSGGALFDTPVLNMPETGIMGVGTIKRRPVIVKDQDGQEVIAIRSMVYLSISYDHRLVDGADASRYLTEVKNRLEEGDFLANLVLD